MDKNILFHNHNVIIKGMGPEHTKLIIPRNMNLAGNGWIGLEGLSKEISVSISDLSIEFDDTLYAAGRPEEDSRYIQNETAVIKCKSLKSLLMRNVHIHVHDLPTTCIDIHRGRNLEIKENMFANYNRCQIGGIIWLKDEMENVSIEHNDFYKYGEDEVIALYDVKNSDDFQSISRKDINICYNRFYCQNENGGYSSTQELIQTGWDGYINRFISLLINQSDSRAIIHHIINGIHFDNNQFYINAPISYLITIAIDKYSIFKDITVNNNVIQYGSWMVIHGDNDIHKWLTIGDFNVIYDTQYDSDYEDDYDSNTIEPVVIDGNSIYCGPNMKKMDNNIYEDMHICLDVNGAKVVFNNNLIQCTREAYTADESYFARKGIELIRCGKKSSEVIVTNNHCEGLKRLINARGNDEGNNSTMRFWISGNHIQGDVRIGHKLYYLNNVYESFCESHLFMTDNDIISDYPIIFLKEFADVGTALFSGNRVYRDMSRVSSSSNEFGFILHSDISEQDSNITSMKLVCCENMFENLFFHNGNTSTSIYSEIARLSASRIKAVHSDNIFKDQVE